MTDDFARGIDDDTFIRNAFRTLLRREPNESEMADWRWALFRGQARAEMIAAVTRSVEFEKIVASPEPPLHPDKAGVVAVARALRVIQDATGVIPDYEKLLSAAYRKFLGPGMVVVDIGAHAGYHLEQFLELVGPSGRVIAFEPMPSFAADLRDHYCRYPNVEVHEVALGSRSGSASFQQINNMPWFSGLHLRRIDEPADITVIDVAVTTVDEAFADLPRLDFLKIDIEGGDVDCLRGAMKTLHRLRPITTAEYGSRSYLAYGHSKETLFEVAGEADYLLSDLFGNVVHGPDQWGNTSGTVYWDFLLLPRERLAWWEDLFLRPYRKQST